jgi:O-antigen/teichoic acid export membrane protein
VADAFQARLALYVRDTPDRSVQLFHRTAVGLFCVGVIPAVVLMLYGEPLFQIFFGGKWLTAGRLAAVVAPWFLAQSIVSPLSRLVFVLEGQRLKLIYDVLALTGMIGVFVFSHWQQISLVHAVMLLSAVGTLTFVVYYLILLRIVSRHRCAPEADHPQPCISL